MSLTQKRRERDYFDRAQPHVPAWTTGTVDDAGESPDLVIQASGRIYGVEIVEHVKPEPREAARVRAEVCGQAHRVYLDRGGAAGLAAQVVFARQPRTAIERTQAADDLLNIVLGCYPAAPGAISHMHLESHGHDFKTPWFSSLWLHHHPEMTRSIWRPVAPWWTPILTAETLEGVIARKEKKLTRYWQRVAEVWLLIVADGFDEASAGTPTEGALSRVYATRFTGVVLFENGLCRATVLQCAGEG